MRYPSLPLMRLRALLLSLLILAAAPPAYAERWLAPGGKATIDLPDEDSWDPVEALRPAGLEAQPDACLIGRRTTDVSKAVMFLVLPGVPQDPPFERMIAGFEAGIFRDTPMRKVSGTRVEVQGRPAYRYLARRPDGSWMAGLVVRRDGTLYHATVVKVDDDPTLDPELARYLDSLRLP